MIGETFRSLNLLMTSRFCYRIDIFRHLEKDALLSVLRDLEEGTILRFPVDWDNGPCILNIDACGYLADNRKTKVIKLTNSQRRLLIKSVNKGLELKRDSFTVDIPGNEYISKLDHDEFD